VVKNYMVALSIVLFGGCGGDNRNFGASADGGTAGDGSGASSATGSGGDVGAAPCEDGDRDCSGNIPRQCDDGEWIEEDECAGTNKVCTGKGVCSPFRLLAAGIDTFGIRPAETAQYVLKEQTLSAVQRVCKGDYCITGSVRP
jgi:hypothetical protein